VQGVRSADLEGAAARADIVRRMGGGGGVRGVPESALPAGGVARGCPARTRGPRRL